MSCSLPAELRIHRSSASRAIHPFSPSSPSLHLSLRLDRRTEPCRRILTSRVPEDPLTIRSSRSTSKSRFFTYPWFQTVYPMVCPRSAGLPQRLGVMGRLALLRLSVVIAVGYLSRVGLAGPGPTRLALQMFFRMWSSRPGLWSTLIEGRVAPVNRRCVSGGWTVENLLAEDQISITWHISAPGTTSVPDPLVPWAFGSMSIRHSSVGA